MALITDVNIKEKPQIEEIVKGNFLIVENENGTNILDFDNFVLGPENVSFYSDFVSVSSSVVLASSTLTTQINSLSASTDSNINTQVNSLSTTVAATYNKIFYQAGQLTFNSLEDTSNSVAVVVPDSISLDASNVTLTLNTTVVPSATGVFVALYPTLNGTSPNYSLQANLTTVCDLPVTVSYNIFKPY